MNELNFNDGGNGHESYLYFETKMGNEPQWKMILKR